MSALYFVSTLPRSGSTLLVNLLAQCPLHHVTPTNDLIELFVNARNRWPQCDGFRAQGLDKIKPRILGSLRGLLHGFYEAELAAGKRVFDKSRGWLAYIELLEQVLQQPVRLLVTVRDVRAIVASLEKLYRKSVAIRPDMPGDAYFQAQTVAGRVQQWLSPSGLVGQAINRLRDAMDRNLSDRLVIIPYRHLTTKPRETMQDIHAALGLEPFGYDPDHVEQVTQEDDLVHGFEGLHTIRSKVEAPEVTPWTGILPDRLAAEIATQFADINQLANN